MTDESLQLARILDQLANLVEVQTRIADATWAQTALAKKTVALLEAQVTAMEALQRAEA